MGNKLDKDYINILQEILEEGNSKKNRTRTGTISIFGKVIRHNMEDGFPILTCRKIFYRGAIEELLWFMRGQTDLKTLVDKNVNIWVGDAFKQFHKSDWIINDDGTTTNISGPGHYGKYIDKEEYIQLVKDDKIYNQLGPIYGFQWRHWGLNYNNIIENNTGGIDQLLSLIHDLKNNPDSRRLIVSSWNVSDLPEMILPPCHYSFQCYTRILSLKERITIFYDLYSKNTLVPTHDFLDTYDIPKRELSLDWTQRSADFPLGVPFNILSYGMLLSILAKIVNMKCGELIGSFKDCHIYDNQIDGIQKLLERENIYDLPKLKLNSEFQNIEKYWYKSNGGFHRFKLDEFLDNISIKNFNFINYKSHEKLDLPLSN